MVEKTPCTYEILAAGWHWQDCVCKSIVVEGVRATGGGNRTVLKEAAGPLQPVPPMTPVEETARHWYQPRPRERMTVEQLVRNLHRGGDARRCLGAAIMLADRRAFPEVTKLVFQSANSDIKNQAMVALYVMDRSQATADPVPGGQQYATETKQQGK